MMYEDWLHNVLKSQIYWLRLKLHIYNMIWWKLFPFISVIWIVKLEWLRSEWIMFCNKTLEIKSIY